MNNVGEILPPAAVSDAVLDSADDTNVVPDSSDDTNAVLDSVADAVVVVGFTNSVWGVVVLFTTTLTHFASEFLRNCPSIHAKGWFT